MCWESGEKVSAPGPTRKVSTSRDTWETPDDLFFVMDLAFGHFDIDLAASDLNTRAEVWFEGPCIDPVDGVGCRCGLHVSYDFNGKSVWLNPPYSRSIEDWVWRCHDLRHEGANVVILLPAATDTKWWQLLVHLADTVYLLVGRVQFKGTTSSNPNGSAIAVFQHGGPPRRMDNADIIMWDWKSELRCESSPVVAGHR